MTSFIHQLRENIKNYEYTLQDKLEEANGISTTWTLCGDAKHPGFFTPFNQKLLGRYDFSPLKTAGMKQAGIAMGLLSAMQLQEALTDTLLVPVQILGSVIDVIQGDWDNLKRTSSGIFHYAAYAVYFSGAFVLNLIKEITAFITRSVATLMAMCIGNNNGNVISHDAYDNFNYDGEMQDTAQEHPYNLELRV